jgi:hypothetical protein
LGTWSCKRFGLLADHNQVIGDMILKLSSPWKNAEKIVILTQGQCDQIGRMAEVWTRVSQMPHRRSIHYSTSSCSVGYILGYVWHKTSGHPAQDSVIWEEKSRRNIFKNRNDFHLNCIPWRVSNPSRYISHKLISRHLHVRSINYFFISLKMKEKSFYLGRWIYSWSLGFNCFKTEKGLPCPINIWEWLIKRSLSSSCQFKINQLNNPINLFFSFSEWRLATQVSAETWADFSLRCDGEIFPEYRPPLSKTSQITGKICKIKWKYYILQLTCFKLQVKYFIKLQVKYSE